MIQTEQNKNKIHHLLFYIATGIIILFGTYIRCRFYIAKIPMWVDEIMLASSFTNRNFLDLFLPLEAYQKAPPLFFVTVLAIRKLFGVNEITLRFIPFVLGILSPFLFFILLKENIKNKFGVITGECLFSFCVPLIYFCAEFKPYGCDVFFCIVLFLIYKYINFIKISGRKTLLYAIGTVSFIYMSFPTIFVIPAMLFSKFHKDRKIDIKVLWIFFAILISGLFLLMYDLGTYKFLLGYWNRIEHGFSLLPSFDFIQDFVCDACKYYIYNFKIKYTIYILLFFIGGLSMLFKDDKAKAVFIFLIITFALIASSINAYPLKPKLALYILPIFILIYVKLFDITNYLKNKYAKFIVSLILVINTTLFVGINIPYFNITQNELVYYNKDSGGRNKSAEDRNAVKDYCFEIIKNFKNGDEILVSSEFLYSLKYYIAYYKSNKTLNIKSYADIADKKLSNIELDNIADTFIKNNLNKNLGMYFLGRDNDGYFQCPDFITIKNLLDKYKIKYTYRKFSNLYIVYTNK